MIDKLLLMLLKIKDRQLMKKIEYLIFNCNYNDRELRKKLEPLEEQGRGLNRLRNSIKRN